MIACIAAQATPASVKNVRRDLLALLDKPNIALSFGISLLLVAFK